MEDRLMGAEFGASCARVCGRCDIIRDNPITEELLKRAQDMIHEDQDYLKDFNAAVNQLRKRQAEFEAEHPGFRDRYSLSRARI